jgi:hypothetical protein
MHSLAFMLVVTAGYHLFAGGMIAAILQQGWHR